uniref:Uncharacterized protein n=1 Tax=Timema monikensis TaxID=170555 RepID=A0A7R9E6K5_9NEOP|nr:unnamed protein product [Timema monikensis]
MDLGSAVTGDVKVGALCTCVIGNTCSTPRKPALRARATETTRSGVCHLLQSRVLLIATIGPHDIAVAAAVATATKKKTLNERGAFTHKAVLQFCNDKILLTKLPDLRYPNIVHPSHGEIKFYSTRSHPVECKRCLGIVSVVSVSLSQQKHLQTGMRKIDFRRSVHTFAWRESGQLFRDRDSSPDLHIIGSLVYRESSALDHANTEVGKESSPGPLAQYRDTLTNGLKFFHSPSTQMWVYYRYGASRVVEGKVCNLPASASKVQECIYQHSCSCRRTREP